MTSSTYYFHIKTKILADFQTCISVPLRVQMFEKCDLVNNEWLLLPAGFTAKFGFVFVLTLENVFT